MLLLRRQLFSLVSVETGHFGTVDINGLSFLVRVLAIFDDKDNCSTLGKPDPPFSQ